MKAEDRTRLVMQAIGWQGGTVHQLCDVLGVDSNHFLYDDLETIESSFERGWFAVRTSKANLPALIEKNKGNLQYMFGIASGQNLENIENL